MPLACDGGFEVLAGGYVCAGAMHGYAWTTAGEIDGAEIVPEDFDDVTSAATRLCVTGNTAGDESWASVGILGMNAGQMYESNRTGEWADADLYDYLKVDVSINSTTTDFALRLKVKTESGGEYCTVLKDGTQFIYFDELTEECWETGNPSFEDDGKDLIEAVMLLVPGHKKDDIYYDFCLNELYPE